MIERLILLKPHIKAVLPDLASEDFWVEIELLSKFFKLFYNATQEVQSDASLLIDQINSFHELWKMMLNFKNAHIATTNPYLRNLVNVITTNAIPSYEKHWNKHANTILLAAAAFLSFNNQAFSHLIGNAAIFIVNFGLKILKRFFVRELQIFKNTKKPDQAELTDEDIKLELTMNISQFHAQEAGFAGCSELFNQLNKNAHSFWVAKYMQYPLLSSVSKCIVSINCSESNVERSFSMQGYIHSDERNRLAPSTVNKLMLIKMNCNLVDNLESIKKEQIMNVFDEDDFEGIVRL